MGSPHKDVIEKQNEADNLDALKMTQGRVLESAYEDDDDEEIISNNKEDLIDFFNFKWYPKLKNYIKRERLDPINHLLRKKIRQERQLKAGALMPTSNIRPKSVSPVRHEPFSKLPDYWQSY